MIHLHMVCETIDDAIVIKKCIMQTSDNPAYKFE